MSITDADGFFTEGASTVMLIPDDPANGLTFSRDDLPSRATIDPISALSSRRFFSLLPTWWSSLPGKNEVYRVTRRYAIHVAVVVYTPRRVQADKMIEPVVHPGFGTADDWIAEQGGPGNVGVTADLPLAARDLAKGARVLDPKWRAFTDNDIGAALAMRELMEGLRQGGELIGRSAAMMPKPATAPCVRQRRPTLGGLKLYWICTGKRPLYCE